MHLFKLNSDIKPGDDGVAGGSPVDDALPLSWPDSDLDLLCRGLLLSSIVVLAGSG